MLLSLTNTCCYPSPEEVRFSNKIPTVTTYALDSTVVLAALEAAQRASLVPGAYWKSKADVKIDRTLKIVEFETGLFRLPAWNMNDDRF